MKKNIIIPNPNPDGLITSIEFEHHGEIVFITSTGTKDCSTAQLQEKLKTIFPEASIEEDDEDFATMNAELGDFDKVITLAFNHDNDLRTFAEQLLANRLIDNAFKTHIKIALENATNAERGNS